MPGRKAFPLRLSQELYDELRRWAGAELRSVNGQIEYILKRAVERRRGEQEVEDPPGPETPAPGSDPRGD